MAKRPLLQALLVLALIGCSRDDDGALAIVFIADAESLFADGVRLSPGAQTLRAATGVGLVSFGGQGEVIPGLADRWIVTEDGRSYIFRLRDGTWPDGQTLTAESARAALQQAIARLRGTSLGLDLAPVEDVRAMAGRVIEIRLSSPVPSMLQLLAQPELTLQNGDEPAGDMLLRREGARGELTMKPPQARGLPEPADWRTYVRPILVSAAPAASALEQFDDGTADIVLGGRIGHCRWSKPDRCRAVPSGSIRPSGCSACRCAARAGCSPMPKAARSCCWRLIGKA
jgi:oligopeptide transport system substrate-binding protein